MLEEFTESQGILGEIQAKVSLKLLESKKVVRFYWATSECKNP